MEMTEHASEIVTVIDPHHPLCGQSERLLGIAMKNQPGRCCVMLASLEEERSQVEALGQRRLNKKTRARLSAFSEAGSES